MLTCECGFYASFGESMKYGWDDPFYSYNVKCPRCGKYTYGDDHDNKVSFEEFVEKISDDCMIMVIL